ncbi:hypothetical protein K1T71_002719 [Dendrolimus kikuchii]|uniref:Uncharacterized protein n=1 Tax=Dendrolimus kikuchii TaxID=765133 RepID=A0ACC1DDN5_9NEOP|nr:hypothetical protein K1T71_002719 [Dendrolimus kikuchii]
MSSLVPANVDQVLCPVCNRGFEKLLIEEHVNKCLFLNVNTNAPNSKRSNCTESKFSPQEKRVKFDNEFPGSSRTKEKQQVEKSMKENTGKEPKTPLAESMRPLDLADIVGQIQAFGPGSMLRPMLEQNKVPNMILWGPPGCGKTSVANVIANICKKYNNMRFVKLSATMSGISDVKDVVKIAHNEAQFKRKTILFMDEIHRFNKLQQDTFLPHVENGTITLIGATTENPSFSLNNALLSRCRVVVLEKLSVHNIIEILKRALKKNKQAAIIKDKNWNSDCKTELLKYLIEEESLKWLAEVCDGDARVALNALELALAARDPGDALHSTGPATLTLEDIQNGIKRSHMVYDKSGEEHYNIISALQKSIRASDDNAALYWTVRALHGGEDPLYIARRLIRTACEDIGLADRNALVEAVACLQGCQHIGMPECDVLLSQCAVRLARAPKSRELHDAMKRCQRSLTAARGPLPSVPLHLRNAPTKLMKQLGYGKGYNISHRDDSGLTYLPEGLEDHNFFKDDNGMD